ncbi:MAG: hypothetical protein IJW13_00125 [Clostridia bacterium]|nr:hypothetical protein [Clostridia bacterium]
MENLNVNQNILKNCYKNAQMALISLDDVIKKAKGALKEVLLCQHDGYEKLSAKIALVATNKDIELPDVGSMQKAMLAASIEMKTMVDDSDSHIAEMTLKGTVTGLTTLIKDISEFGHMLDDQILEVVTELKNFEEDCEQELKKYL